VLNYFVGLLMLHIHCTLIHEEIIVYHQNTPQIYHWQWNTSKALMIAKPPKTMVFIKMIIRDNKSTVSLSH
jgi:hypothetical protein